MDQPQAQPQQVAVAAAPHPQPQPLRAPVAVAQPVQQPNVRVAQVAQSQQPGALGGPNFEPSISNVAPGVLESLSANPRLDLLLRFDPRLMMRFGSMRRQNAQILRRFYKMDPIKIDFSDPTTAVISWFYKKKNMHRYRLYNRNMTLRPAPPAAGQRALPFSEIDRLEMKRLLKNCHLAADACYFGVKVNVSHFFDWADYTVIWEQVSIIDTLVLIGDVPTDVNIDNFMELVQIKKNMIIEVKDIGENLQSHYVWLKTKDTLKIVHCPWFDDHLLMESNNEMLEVGGTMVTSTGMNRWLNRWITSGDKAVREVNVGSQVIFVKEYVLHGITIKDTNQPVREFDWEIGAFKSKFLSHSGGSIVKRANGDYVTFVITPNRVHFSMTYLDDGKAQEPIAIISF